MTYTDVFSGNTVYPSDVSYREITLTANLVLSWPLETSSEEVSARIIEVTASTTGLQLWLPVASAVSVGETLLINNFGGNAFTLHDNDGTQILSSAPGNVWQIYLTDNTTDAGVWRVFQYGSALSAVNASALAGTGIVAVGTFLSQSIPVSSIASNYVLGANDRARLLLWTGSSGTFTLPSAPVIGNNWFTYIRNSGGGQLVITPVGGNTVDGAATKTLQPGESLILVSSGTDFYTIGFGQSATFAFDFTIVDVAGTGNYTLSSAELNRISYNFIGLLTGNRSVIVPDTVQQYWITNSTTGAFSLTVKTAAGVGLVVAQGEGIIGYSNGTDVLNASTAGISLPITVAQGGTGAITENAALTNLGGTSVGIAVFTAVDGLAGFAALGGVDGGSF